MNRIYRKVFSKRRGMFVAVGENTRTHSGGGPRKRADVQSDPEFVKTMLSAAVAAVLGLGLATGAQAERSYDISKTTGYGYIFTGTSEATTGTLSTYGGSDTGNLTSVINTNVNLISDGTNSGYFLGTDSIYLAGGTTFSLGSGTTAYMRDYTDSVTSEARETNFIVRGTVTTASGSNMNLSYMALDDAGSVTIGGLFESQGLDMTDTGSFTVAGGKALIGSVGITGSGRLAVTSGYLGFAPFTSAAAGDPLSSAATAATTAAGLTSRAAVLDLGTVGLTLGATSLQVGTGAGSLNTGDVYFGADSALILNTASAAESFKFLAGDGTGTFTVKPGSELVVTGASYGKNVLIAGNYNAVDMASGAWEGSSVVNKSSLSDVSMTTAFSGDGKSVYLVVGAAGSGSSSGGSSATNDVFAEWDVGSTQDVVNMDHNWQAYYWGHCGEPASNNVDTVWYQEGYTMTGGVYSTNTVGGEKVDVGGIGNSGRLVFNRVYADSTFVDAKTWVNAAGETLPQVGAVYWINDLYASNKSTFDVMNLRTSVGFRNASSSFKLETLHAKDSAVVQNSGYLEIQNAYLGLTNDFTLHTLGVVNDIDTDAMATLMYNESATGSLTNSGTFKVTGTLVNYVSMSETAPSAVWNIANWDNHADATVTTMTAGSLTNAAGKTISATTLNTTSGTNSGTIKVAGEFAGTLTNAGTFTFDGTRGANITSGTLTNTGTFNAAEKLTIAGGEVVQSSGTTMAFTALDVAGGKLTVNSGKTAAASAALTVTSGSIANKGTLTYGSAHVKGGSITGTGTLGTAETSLIVDAGASVQQGTINGKITNAGTIKASAVLNSYGAWTNNGTVNVSSATSDSVVTNAGSFTAATGSFTGFTNNAAATLTGGNVSTGMSGLVNNGTVTLSGDYSGKLTNNSEMSAVNATLAGTGRNSGTLALTGTLTLNGDFENTGTISQGNVTVANGKKATLGGTITGGTLNITNGTAEVTSANVSFSKLESTGGGALVNTKDLTFSNIAASGVNYAQTGGSIKATDGSFFANSTLNISGGRLEALSTLGSGNTFNLSGSTIPTYDGSSENPLDANWKSGQTVVSVGTLNSASSVNLDEGSVLEAESISLTSNSLTLNGGALASSLNQMFNGLTETFYTMEGAETSLETNVIGAVAVSSVKSDFASNLSFGANGGTLVLTDSVVSLNVVADANAKLQALTSAMGKDVHVVFTGTAASSSTANSTFTSDTFNALKTEQSASSDFKQGGVVFATMTYSNKNDSGVAKTNLVVGNAGADSNTYYLDQSIGFKKISDTENVTVQDGKKLVLAGQTGTSVSLIGSSGKVTAKGSGSVVQLGSAGVSGALGQVASAELTSGGELKVSAGGNFTVGSIALANAGKVTVDAGSALTATAIADAAGTILTNSGTLNAGGASIAGSWTNSGTLTSAATQLAAGSVLTTKASSGSTFSNAVSVAGKVANEAGGTMTFENGLTVTNAVTTAADKFFSNAGTIIAKGTNSIAGAVSLESGSRTVASGITTVASSGTVKNAGDSRYSNIKLSGRYTMSADSLLYADTMSTSATSRLMLGANSLLLAKDLSIVGAVGYTYQTSEVINSASLVVGAQNVANTLTDYDDVRTRVNALVAGTDMATAEEHYSISEMAMPQLRAAVFAQAAESDRTFDIGKTDDWGYTYQGATGETNGLQSVYGGTNDSGFIDADVTLVTANDRSGRFFGQDNVYLSEDASLTFRGGTVGKFLDYTNDATGELLQTNLIVRGTLTGEAESAIKATNLVLDGSGRTGIAGTYEGDLLHVTDNGEFKVEGGSALLKGAKLEGGTLRVTSGVLGFGEFMNDDATRLTAADLNAARAELTQKNAVLWLDNTAVSVEGVSIQVGSLAQGDELRAGDVYFGADSALIVDAKTVADNFKFMTAETGSFTVKTGSELVVTGASWGRNVIIADGFESVLLEDGAWQGDSLINRTALNGSVLSTGVTDDGRSLILTVGEETTVPEPVPPQEEGGSTAEGGDVTGGDSGATGGSGTTIDRPLPSVPYTDISKILTNVAGAAIINPVINEDPYLQQFDSDDHAVRFIARAMNSQYGVNRAQQEKTVNSVFAIGAASGMHAYTHAENAAFMDTIEARMAGEVMPMARGALWAKGAYGKTKADSLMLGSTATGYEADTKGFVFGADAPLGRDFKAGAAVTYIEGDLESSGSLEKTKTDAELWGFAAYFAKSFGDVAMSGQLGFMNARGDVTQSTASTMGLSDTKADIESFSILAGLTGEMSFRKGAWTVTPHAGLRWIHTDYDRTDISVDGKKAFEADAGTADVLQVPLGVRMTGEMKKGWFVWKPKFDLTAVLQTGDTELDTTVRAAGGMLNAADTVTYETAGDVYGRLSLGLDIKRGGFSMGLSCTGTKGNKGTSGYSANATLKLMF